MGPCYFWILLNLDKQKARIDLDWMVSTCNRSLEVAFKINASLTSSSSSTCTRCWLPSFQYWACGKAYMLMFVPSWEQCITILLAAIDFFFVLFFFFFLTCSCTQNVNCHNAQNIHVRNLCLHCLFCSLMRFRSGD